MQRTLIIGATVVVLAGAGVAGYFYFSNDANITVAPSASGDANLPIIDRTMPAPVTEVGETSTTTIISPNTPVQGTAARLVKISAGPVVPGAIVVSKPATASSSRSEEHTSELQSQFHLVCRLLL